VRLAAPLLVFLLPLALSAQPAKVDPRWTPLEFLIGNWVGEGGGGPGQGSGGFSFLPDQNGAVLIRRNFANYPATKDKPAISHTDLMIVYRDSGATQPRAIYFDDEEHTIHYAVEPSSDGNSVQFVSDAVPSQPRYRLTYRKTGPDRVSIQFEIASDGQKFSTYINASARRK
jgi:hypothetical protein